MAILHCKQSLLCDKGWTTHRVQMYNFTGNYCLKHERKQG